MSYGYYPQYYTSGQTSYPYQQQQQYYTPRTSSFSTNSDEPLTNFQAPVASNWLNQGTNATTYQQNNPYMQQQTYVSDQYQKPTYSQSAYKQEYGSPTTTQSEKTFTSRSNKSKHESRTLSRTSEIISEALKDDVNQLTPQLEAAYEAATGKRRSPVVKRQVITMPGQAGRVQQVVRRLPTPTPDVIERIFIVKPQRDTINLIIERPSTPPVQYKDKTIYGKSRRPIINPKIVSVQPTHYYPQLMDANQNANYQYQFQQNMIQDAPNAANGYLLAPIKYNENQIQTMAMNSMMMPAVASNEQQQSMHTMTQNNNNQNPTFSTNVLQPYNPPMFDQYQQQQMGGGGYQQGAYPGYTASNFGGQMF